jgi:hypothetical protein
MGALCDCQTRVDLKSFNASHQICYSTAILVPRCGKIGSLADSRFSYQTRGLNFSSRSLRPCPNLREEYRRLHVITASVSRSHSKRKHITVAGRAKTQYQPTSEILLGEAATLTASVVPDDTCAAWSKRHNEEANPKESPCEEDFAPTPSEARYQAP